MREKLKTDDHLLNKFDGQSHFAGHVVSDTCESPWPRRSGKVALEDVPSQARDQQRGRSLGSMSHDVLADFLYNLNSNISLCLVDKAQIVHNMDSTFYHATR